MRVRVKRLTRNPEVRGFVTGISVLAVVLVFEPWCFVVVFFALGRITQLIALTGKGGGWRKTIIDRSIAYVWLLSNLPTILTRDSILRLFSQVDGKERFLADRRPRSPTLRRRITL
jgi:hypothetical protein